MTTSLLVNGGAWSKMTNNVDFIATNNNKTASQKPESVPPERLEQIARAELREDEFTREECLKQFKEWIGQNQDIENCITDDKFLLRFLRVKKFSLVMAQQMLLKYLNFRKRFRHILYNLDCLDDKVNALFSNGYIVVSPFRDSAGRRVVIHQLSCFDPHNYSSTDMARVEAIAYETLLEDEANQIIGFNHLGCLNGVTPAFVTMWSVSEFTGLLRWGEQSYPLRHKEINLLNLPTPLKYMYDIIKSLVRSEKIRQRMKIHDSLEALHSQVGTKCLPLEMGGEMPLNEMIDLWKQELLVKRNRLLSYDQMNLLSDRGIIRSSNNKQAASSSSEENAAPEICLAGSFRKLQVD